MATTRKTPTRRTRTRAEISDEFEGLKSEVEGAEAVDPKTASASRARASAVKTAVASLSPEAAANSLTKVQLDVQRTLAGVSEQIITKAAEVQQLDEAKKLLEQEIEDLHKIDLAATAIDILVQDHELRTKTLDEEYNNRRVQLETAHADTSKRFQEEEAALKILRAREREEYEYKKAIERRNSEDAFQQKMVTTDRANTERQQALDKNWREREGAIAGQEKEIVELRARAAGWDEAVKKETDKAVAIATNSLKHNLTTEFSLRSKDFETNARILQSTVDQLTSESARKDTAIQALQTQLDLASAQVKSIAEKAIDGASKRDALEQIVTFQKDQAANGPSARGKS